MRKIILTSATFLILFASHIFGQTKAGDVFIDAYYGFPDWYNKYQFRNDYPTNALNNYSINSTGFIGGRVEYLIAKRIGFGLDVWYVKTTVSGSTTEITTYGSYYDNNGYNPGVNIQNKYDITESLGRLAALGRFIVHLGSSSKVDPYVHVGFGYVNYRHTYSNSNSNTNMNNGYYNYRNNNNNENYVPIGARAGFGMRIFFNEHLGANIDLGIGGALFTTGLTYKFLRKTSNQVSI